MAWIDDIQAYLSGSSAGCGLTSATNLFISDLPTTPDKAVCLYDYGGASPSFLLGADLLDRPSFQVLARDAVLADARTLAELVYARLLTARNKTLSPSGKVYLAITPNQAPFFLKRDDKGRSIVACNYDVQKHV